MTERTMKSSLSTVWYCEMMNSLTTIAETRTNLAVNINLFSTALINYLK